MRYFILITSLVIAFANVEARQSGSFLIKDVNVFLPEGFVEDMDVLVEDGEIKQVGKNLASDYPVVAGDGHTLLPGLVNAHVHSWVPYHLYNAAWNGVMYVHDMHSTNDSAEQLRGMRELAGYADFYGTGYAATVAEGHGTQFGYEVPVIGPDQNCYEFVDRQVAAGADHVKIIYEPAMPTLTIEQVDSLISRTHEHGKKAVIHVSLADDAMDVMRLGADGLVHLWRDRQLTDAEMAEFAASDIFVVPTAAVVERVLDLYRRMKSDRKIISRVQMMDELKRAYDAGVTLLTGTDPPNFGLDYGESLHHEMVLLAESGIPIEEVLRAATVYPHTAYDYPVQAIAEGMPATFFLIAGDPREDINDTKQIRMRWKDGALMEESKEY